MNIKNKYNRIHSIIALLLCFMFVFQVANRSVYVHSHITKDGTVVNHAHPYNKSDESAQGKMHTHNGIEFFIITQLDVLFLMAFTLFVIVGISKSKEYFRLLIKGYQPECISPKCGRSPPLASYLNFDGFFCFSTKC